MLTGVEKRYNVVIVKFTNFEGGFLMTIFSYLITTNKGAKIEAATHQKKQVKNILEMLIRTGYVVKLYTVDNFGHVLIKMNIRKFMQEVAEWEKMEKLNSSFVKAVECLHPRLYYLEKGNVRHA